MLDVIDQTFKAFLNVSRDPWRNLGNTLLLGEGNLSFAKSLLYYPDVQIRDMVATIYEGKKEISHQTQQNSNWLKNVGVRVLYGVDATHLERSLVSNKFDTIIFQFPNVGSRQAKYGQNANHVMIRNFLRSAKPFLKQHSKVLITTVDSIYYDGVFQFDKAADFAGYKITSTFPFDPCLFMGYNHTNTKDSGSALENHHSFVTRIFKIKA